MKTVIVSFFLLAGSFFMLVSAIGVLRFPDFLIRMHAATKSASFGSVLMLIAVALYFLTPRILVEVFIIVVFIFLTAPIAAHMIGRAGFFLNIPLWEKTSPNHLSQHIARQENTSIDL